jgi:hypothetical protein
MRVITAMTHAVGDRARVCAIVEDRGTRLPRNTVDPSGDFTIGFEERVLVWSRLRR